MTESIQWMVTHMGYITTQQASEKWGIHRRQVQWLCNVGKVAGAIRFSRAWAIPEDAGKPVDGRCRPKQANGAIPPLGGGTSVLDLSVFMEAFEHFPYSMNITNMQGTMVYANTVFFKETLPGTREKALGTYNILAEPMLDLWGLRDHVVKAFQGKKVHTPQLRFPNKDLQGDKYGKNAAFFSLYNDVYSYPLFDANGIQQYMVTVLIPIKKMVGRREVIQAREYIDTHWMKPFSSKLLADSVHLSPSRLVEVFREDTGFSPHDYYLEVKMVHLQEQLLDPNNSVGEAFMACGMDYNSHYTRIFRKFTGMTPLQFRKQKR